MGIVWVLGAGFSKPLGGPLLGTVLSAEAEQDLVVRYPQDEYTRLWDDHARMARNIYWYGYRLSRDRAPIADAGTEDLWKDAEEYLDYLATAAQRGEGSPGHKRLNRITRGCAASWKLGALDVKSLAKAAARLMAA